MARKRSATRAPTVAAYYPDRKPLTTRQVMNHYSKKTFVKAVNELIENPDERFAACNTFNEMIQTLNAAGDVSVSATPDKKPFPKGQSRIVFLRRSTRAKTRRA